VNAHAIGGELVALAAHGAGRIELARVQAAVAAAADVHCNGTQNTRHSTLVVADQLGQEDGGDRSAVEGVESRTSKQGMTQFESNGGDESQGNGRGVLKTASCSLESTHFCVKSPFCEFKHEPCFVNTQKGKQSRHDASIQSA
jgi:aspartokinase